MKVIAQKDLTYVNIPKNVLQLSSLSLEAKGLYASLFAMRELPQKSDALTELMQWGLVEYTKSGDIKVKLRPNKTKTDTIPVEPPHIEKKTTDKFSKMVQSVKDYTNEVELQEALINYFSLRMSPAQDSRFYQAGPIQTWQINMLLTQLNDIDGDKLAAVQYCTKKQYFKFFPKPEQKTMDGVISHSYSKTEQQEIHEKLTSLQESGEVY